MGFVPGEAVRPLGLLLLDTRFPRLAGDAGLPASWPCAVRTHVVAQAVPARVVQSAEAMRASGLIEAFVHGARSLAAEGVGAITTSCGFLVLFQRELQEAVDVPVVTSSLLLLPGLLAAEEKVGVLTISAERLGDGHLLAAGVPADRLRDVIVEGVDPDGEFVRSILGNDSTMDVEAARADVIAAAVRARRRASSLRTLVLECTNMPPHADAIRAATGLRVLSLFDAVSIP